jgi:hypothetical protein
MKRITPALLIAAAFAVCAQAGPLSLTLLPTSGTVGGGPGSVVGWGFTITNSLPSDWVVLTGSAFTGSPVYGSYVDYLSLVNAPLYVAGPSPESPTISSSWNRSSNPRLGLGEFDINSTALPGAIVAGSMQVDYDVFSQDPNDPNFDPGSFVTSGTVSASAQVSVAAAPTPEPATSLMMSTALLSLAFAGLRRGYFARLATAAPITAISWLVGTIWK